MAKNKSLFHILNCQQFSLTQLDRIFSLTRDIKKEFPSPSSRSLKNKRMITLFFEPSTRTRLSFEMAMSYLGGQVFSVENAKESSSATKGETIEDTIKVLCGYHPDVIILRHHEEGSVARAAKVSSVPIINAGDGRGQHPTQALLDLYTIQEKLGKIHGLKIAMVGDLVNSRTIRSLCYLLGNYTNITIYFVSPVVAKMKDDVKEYLKNRNIQFYESTDLRRVAPLVDVIYQNRIQKERGGNFNISDRSLGYFIIDKEILGLMKKSAIILNPLPRIDEIVYEADQDPRAAYFDQAENGLYVRMALLKMILDSTNH